MTTQYPSFDSSVRPSEDLETTEPDFWLDDLDLVPDSQSEAASTLASFDAKTEPARHAVDEISDTLPGAPSPVSDPSRERALLAFLETVRRVFGDGPGEP